jgi:hypothetical protein
VHAFCPRRGRARKNVVSGKFVLGAQPTARNCRKSDIAGTTEFRIARDPTVNRRDTYQVRVMLCAQYSGLGTREDV